MTEDRRKAAEERQKRFFETGYEKLHNALLKFATDQGRDGLAVDPEHLHIVPREQAATGTLALRSAVESKRFNVTMQGTKIWIKDVSQQPHRLATSKAGTRGYVFDTAEEAVEYLLDATRAKFPAKPSRSTAESDEGGGRS